MGCTMRGMPQLAAGLLAAGLGLATPAAAADETAEAEPKRGWSLSARYKGDVVGVATGGVARATRYLDNIDGALDADLDTLVGWRRGSAHVSLLSNTGGRPNDLAGSIQGIDNIEVSDHRVKLYEAWIEQGIGANATLRTGLYDVNSEFYANDAAALLISPMFGVGSELAATGVNGPAIFPSTALAARLKVTTPKTYGSVALVNARAGTIGDVGGIDFSGREGALLIGEAGWTGSGRIAIGAWAYSQSQPTIVPPDISQGPGFHASRGAFLLAEHDLAGTPDGVHHLTGFLRLGLSEGKTTPFCGGWQSGVLLRRPFAARPASAVLIGAGSGVLSQSYRRSNPPALPPLKSTETILEATFTDELLPGIALQPDIQYVINPAADRTIPNALVLGLRLTIGWTTQ